jgi:hypothetical protein
MAWIKVLSWKVFCLSFRGITSFQKWTFKNGLKKRIKNQEIVNVISQFVISRDCPMQSQIVIESQHGGRRKEEKVSVDANGEGYADALSRGHS